MAIMAVNTWVITAGVLLHGRRRAIPDAIQATPAATTASSAMNPIAFEAVQAWPDAESIRLSTITTHRAAASAACTTAAVSSIGLSASRARGPAASVAAVPPEADGLAGTPSAERIPIVSHPPRHR